MLTPRRTFPELPAPPATFKAKIPQWAGFRKMCFKVWEELTIPVYAKQPRYGDGTRGAYIRTDVGPVPRQLLTRGDDFFDGQFTLTLGDKLIRGQMPE